MRTFSRLVASTTIFALLASSVAIGQQPQSAPTASTTTSAAPTPPVVKRTPDGKLVLEDGTPVRLRLNRTLSSADCKTGDRVDFEVLDPVKLENEIVIPQGSIALASVTEAEHKKSMGRAGKLNVAIESVKLSNGEKANLRAIKETKGGGHVGAMTGAMVATGIVFFPVAPLFLFIHGKDITIPKGTEITAYVNGDTPYTPPVPVAAANPPSAIAPQSAELIITSAPDGADIEIDGAYNGSTPSTVNVGAGEHTVTIKKKGFTTWERKVRTTGGRISVKAEMEPAPATDTAVK